MSAPSNMRMGELLGVSHATVSRWKSGDRLPELANMQKISAELGWSLDDQVQARDNGKYASEFSRRLSAVESGDPVGTVGQAAAQDQPPRPRTSS